MDVFLPLCSPHSFTHLSVCFTPFPAICACWPLINFSPHRRCFFLTSCESPVFTVEEEEDAPLLIPQWGNLQKLYYLLLFFYFTCPVHAAHIWSNTLYSQIAPVWCHVSQVNLVRAHVGGKSLDNILQIIERELQCQCTFFLLFIIMKQTKMYCSVQDNGITFFLLCYINPSCVTLQYLKA